MKNKRITKGIIVEITHRKDWNVFSQFFPNTAVEVG